MKFYKVRELFSKGDEVGFLILREGKEDFCEAVSSWLHSFLTAITC